jgi:prolyl-tRNA editing enzyme YbaK/EbsC (Cys-tRNA(Pro) deacylase)
VIRAVEDYEGGNLPVGPSLSGPALFDENALRDPYVLNSAGREYLFYTVRGEKGIALCELVK